MDEMQVNGLLYSLMKNGDRLFATLPEAVYPYEVLRNHASLLPGIILNGFVSDGITEVWLDFTYKENKFSINNQCGEFWFFVQNPNCPDDTLLELVSHFKALLSPKR